MAAPERIRPAIPVLALFLGVIGISLGSIFVRFAEAPSLVTAAYRVGLAALVFLPLCWWKSRDELRGLSRRDFRISALSGLFLAMHFAAWITSLSYTSVANSVVLVNTIPIWVGLLSPFVTREPVGRGVAIGIVFGVTGAVMMSAGSIDGEKGALLGDCLAVVGAIFASFYIMLGRNLRRRVSLLPYITVCYGCAAVLLVTVVLALRLPVTGYSARTMWAFVGLAIISQCIGHTTYNWALKWVSAGIVSIALLSEPIGATALAYLIFGETLTWIKAAGGVLILWGIYYAASSRT